jgi:MFS family permease
MLPGVPANAGFYPVAFVGSVFLTLFVTFFARESGEAKAQTSSAFRSFQSTYLHVFWLMMAGDWLQGPYVYALYKSYGYEQADIAVLFVAGFGSSMVFGTFIGSMADRFGRKKFALLYVVTYVASCLTKHYSTFYVLMLGRVLGGISTSLLFSVFEAWLVSEHNSRGYSGAWLGGTFSSGQFGNSLVAIIAGLVAQPLADMSKLTPVAPGSALHYGGYTAPFDLSIGVLTVGGLLIMCSWSENSTGNAGEPPCSVTSLRAALRLILSNRAVLYAGAMQSLFEGSMYTFVFMWTPVLTEPAPAPPPPFGLIFSTFMVMSMCGSSAFTILSKANAPASFMPMVFFAAASGLAMPVFFESSKRACLAGMLIMEFCCGMYFPAMYTIKSKVVPEESRAAIYNLFRVPLNIIVLAVLLTDMPRSVTFSCCVVMLTLAALVAKALQRITRTTAVQYELGNLLGAGQEQAAVEQP